MQEWVGFGLISGCDFQMLCLCSVAVESECEWQQPIPQLIPVLPIPPVDGEISPHTPPHPALTTPTHTVLHPSQLTNGHLCPPLCLLPATHNMIAMGTESSKVKVSRSLCSKSKASPQSSLGSSQGGSGEGTVSMMVAMEAVPLADTGKYLSDSCTGLLTWVWSGVGHTHLHCIA